MVMLIVKSEKGSSLIIGDWLGQRATSYAFLRHFV